GGLRERGTIRSDPGTSSGGNELPRGVTAAAGDARGPGVWPSARRERQTDDPDRTPGALRPGPFRHPAGNTGGAGKGGRERGHTPRAAAGRVRAPVCDACLPRSDRRAPAGESLGGNQRPETVRILGTEGARWERAYTDARRGPIGGSQRAD